MEPLKLHKETLRHLNDPQLAQVNGGADELFTHGPRPSACRNGCVSRLSHKRRSPFCGHHMQVEGQPLHFNF